MMKLRVLWSVWLLPGILLLAGGCSKNPASDKKSTQSLKDIKVASRDTFQSALDTFRFPENPRATDDWTRFREGLRQLDSTFASPELIQRINDLSASERKYLVEQVHLTDEELAEVEATSFRTADAHYLDECFLLRDAARALEARGLSPLEQARCNFRWVMRNVYLHDEGEPWVPPAFVLRRGYGNALERALVFLALLRQSNLEGCLLVVPSNETKNFLVAVLDPKTSQLHLFDTRLGLALPGKEGKTTATLKEVQDDAKLLEPTLLTPDDAKKWEIRLVCPLYALAPRMLMLQQGLSAHDTVALYLNPQQLSADIAKASRLPVKVWNDPAHDGKLLNSPTRSLRLLLPKSDGGLDETNRALRLIRQRLPLDQVAINYAQLGFFRDWSPPAFDTLMGITSDLFGKYDLQLREMYLRGLYEPILRRQERLRAFVQNDALTGLAENKKFLAEVAIWRKNLRVAYENVKLQRDAASHDQAMSIAQALWSEDQFIGWLINLDNEKKLDHEIAKSTLTGVLAIGVRDYFESELARYQACIQHEKAEHAQAYVQSLAKPSKSALLKAHEAWSRAKSSWSNFYLDRFVPNADTLTPRLNLIRTRIAPDQIGMKLGLLEHLHQQVHHYFEAHLRLAECLEHLEGNKTAAEQLQRTTKELDEVEQKGLLAEAVKKLREQVDAIPVRSVEVQRQQRLWQERLDALARDWQEGGAYFWMRRYASLARSAGKGL